MSIFQTIISEKISQIRKLQDEIDELKMQELVITMSDFEPIDSILRPYVSRLYTGKIPSGSWGYATLTTLSFTRFERMSKKCWKSICSAKDELWSRLKHHYPSATLNQDLVVFVGVVKFTDAEKELLKKYRIQVKYVPGASIKGH